MAGKRKRRRVLNDDSTKCHKRPKLDGRDSSGNPSIKHPALRLYYPRIVTLKEYLISKLPSSSVSRRDKIASIGNQHRGPPKVDRGFVDFKGRQASNSTNLPTEDGFNNRDRERDLAKLLETTLVGLRLDTPSDVAASRQKDFVSFSQQVSLVTGSSTGGMWTTQSEVCFEGVRISSM